MTVTGAALVASRIADAGVRHAFGIPGQRILPLFHELANNNGVPVVLTRHEQGAAFMADAYARLHGIGCCLATSGPGGINLLTGVAASYMDSIPVVAITAQAATTEFGRYGIQEGTGLGRTPDIMAMFRATTKESLQPRSADELAAVMDRAFAVCRSGRPGPVHVDIPSDLFLDTTGVTGPAVPAAATTDRPSADEAALRALADAIAAAERPLLLAGNGVARAGAAGELMRLARAANLPVAGSFLAKSVLDELDPLVLGPVGTFGVRAANEALHREADLVVALGVAFSYLTSAAWSASLDGPRLARVDIDPRELDNNYRADVRLCADVADVLRGLAPLLAGVDKRGAARVADLARAHPDAVDTSVSDDRIHPVEVCRLLNDELDEHTSVIVDVGQNAYWAERHLRTRGDGRFVINGGLGSMGHAVAGALGLWLARQDGSPHERVLCVCGDGGFMMGALEISTCVDQGADIVWVVFNNRTLGTQRAWFAREGHPVVAADPPPTDHIGLARSLGARGIQVRTPTELKSALHAARERRGAVVIDVLIDPDPAPEPYTG